MATKFMPRLRSTLTALVASDFCALFAAFVLAYLGRLLTGGDLDVVNYIVLLPGYLLFVCLYAALGLYPGILMPPSYELKRLSIATSTGFLFLSFLMFLGQQGVLYSRSIMLTSWLLALGMVPLFRFLTRRAFAGHSWWGYPVILFSLPEKGDPARREFLAHPEHGLYISKSVFLDPEAYDKFFVSDSMLPLADTEQMEAGLRELQKNYPGSIAFLIGEDLSPAAQQELILRLGRHFKRVIVQLESSWTRQATLQVADVPGGLVLTMRQNLLDPNRMRMKRLLDITLCLLASVFLLLLIPLLALCIRLDSRGPVFFTQKRVGQNGRHIRVWKFRTMVANAEEVLSRVLEEDPALKAQWEADQKLENDPRLTRVGAFLRRTSLDELPQIFNVLKNEMSLVGPRPIVDSEIERYGEAYDLYTRVKPGITGLWQVSGSNDLEYAARIRLDQHYVYNWSVWLDIYILIRTIPAMLSGSGAY